MNLTKNLTPRPSNLLGAGLTAGISVIMTMISRRNNPAPASGIDTAIRAAKWGLGGYLIGSFVDVQKITRLGDGGVGAAKPKMLKIGKLKRVKEFVFPWDGDYHAAGYALHETVAKPKKYWVEFDDGYETWFYRVTKATFDKLKDHKNVTIEQLFDLNENAPFTEGPVGLEGRWVQLERYAADFERWKNDGLPYNPLTGHADESYFPESREDDDEDED